VDPSAVPTVTCPVDATTIEFDWTIYSWKITVNSPDSSITDTNPADVVVLLNGQQQTVDSVSASQLVVIVDNLVSGFDPLDLVIYFSEGIPNYDTTPCPAITLIEPRIIELSSDYLSAAGSVIYANVAGVGPADSDRIQLVDNNAPATELCDKVVVLAYGLVQCKTKVGIFGLTDVAVKDTISTNVYPYLEFGGSYSGAG
jgi:hypothetical protein